MYVVWMVAWLETSMIRLDLTVSGCMNVTKSTEKCPMTPLDLHAAPTLSAASQSMVGGTDVCGTDTPHTW